VITRIIIIIVMIIIILIIIIIIISSSNFQLMENNGELQVPASLLPQHQRYALNTNRRRKEES